MAWADIDPDSASLADDLGEDFDLPDNLADEETNDCMMYKQETVRKSILVFN